MRAKKLVVAACAGALAAAGLTLPPAATASAASSLEDDKYGRADLAIGANGEDIGTAADAGAVWVLRGTTSGLTTSYATSFNGSDFGLGGAGRQFGTLLR